MIKNLPDKLREVIGLHEFAELFGFDWENDDWTWSDVAKEMALEVEEYYRRGYEDGLQHPECYCPICFYKARFVKESDTHWYYVCPICGCGMTMSKGTADGNSDYQF